MKKDGITVKMPSNPLPSVIGWLLEIGLAEAAGMGTVPIGWSTIDAWQRTTGVQLAPWQARLLRHLSTEYVAESRKAEDATCPAPWRVETTDKEREIAQRRLEMVLG